MTCKHVMYPDFFLYSTGFFQGKHLIQFFLANNMQDFRNFELHNCILNFDAEQSLGFQFNLKPLKKIGLFKR